MMDTPNAIIGKVSVEEIKEREEWEKTHPNEMTPEERIVQLEEELKATKILLGLEV